MELVLSPGDIVLDGDTAPSPKNFRPCLLCTNGWVHHDPTWYIDRPQPRGTWCSMGTQPLPKKGAAPPPQFSAHVYCGQTDGWIKMAIGTEVGLGPGHLVLDGEPPPLPKKGTEPPIFGPFLLSPNGWMNQDSTWHGGGPWSKPHCARRDTSSPPQKGDRPPIFGASAAMLALQALY